MIRLRLSKSGYGSLAELKSLEAREILQAVHYEKFIEEYETTFVELNKGDSA